MGKYFGTDGFRGEANSTLTVDHAYKTGRYIGWYFCQKNPEHHCRILIGKDTRRSGYMLESALEAGLTASGADVYLMHVTTTPSVSYITRTEDFDCGIMITASHNPYYDNGIKLLNRNGEKMEEAVLNEVERYIDGEIEEPAYATRESLGVTYDHASGRNRYIGFLISISSQSFKGLRIGLDCANGASYMIAKAVFDALGAKTYVIHNEPNGTNINMHCGSTHMEDLVALVKEKELDMGFAFDGDADRCLCVDEKGNVVSGDHILYIYGRYMKERGKLINNTVVTTIMSNLGLFRAFDEIGIDYDRTKVGDKYVYESMVKNGHRIGGEQSGHIIFSKYGTTGDGILTAIKMVEVCIAKKTTLSRLCSPLRIYPQLLKNIRVKDKAETLSNPEVMAAVAHVTEVLGRDGRILVRESGTEPVIRVMVEADTDALCEQYVNEVIDTIEKTLK